MNRKKYTKKRRNSTGVIEVYNTSTGKWVSQSIYDSLNSSSSNYDSPSSSSSGSSCGESSSGGCD